MCPPGASWIKLNYVSAWGEVCRVALQRVHASGLPSCWDFSMLTTVVVQPRQTGVAETDTAVGTLIKIAGLDVRANWPSQGISNPGIYSSVTLAVSVASHHGNATALEEDEWDGDGYSSSRALADRSHAQLLQQPKRGRWCDSAAAQMARCVVKLFSRAWSQSAITLLCRAWTVK